MSITEECLSLSQVKEAAIDYFKPNDLPAVSSPLYIDQSLVLMQNQFSKVIIYLTTIAPPNLIRFQYSILLLSVNALNSI